MKILVPVKRVIDLNVKVRAAQDTLSVGLQAAATSRQAANA